MEYLEDNDLPEEVSDRGITKEMRNSLDTAVSVTAENYLTAEAKLRLGLDQQQASVADLIALILGRYMGKSEERQDQLRRVAENIKKCHNSSAIEYATKHRPL